MKEKIKKNIIMLSLLLGLGLFTYGLFGFQSDYYCGEGDVLPPNTSPLRLNRLKCIDPVVYYYYPENCRILLATGVILIAIGILKRKKI